MNSDIDSTQNLLLWFLIKFDPTFLVTSHMAPENRSLAEAYVTEAGSFGVGSDATSSKPSHHQGSEPEASELGTIGPSASKFLSTERLASYPSTSHSRVVSFTTYNPRFSVASRGASATNDISMNGIDTESTSQTAQSFYFGEIHAVQERYHSLLKQRLHLEYAKNPPLFPWETEVSEYPAEVSDSTGAAIEIAPLWRTHVSELTVPGLLPQPLLNALFARCQALAKQPLKQGIRLVKAVEDIFPDQGDLLEPIADMVLVPAYRSDLATQEALTQELATVAGGYDSARPEQQIALSMLAAQEILGALTLSISTLKPKDEKQWVTSYGALSLSASYLDEQLTVSALLPSGGQVRLWDGELEECASKSQPGALDLTLTNPEAHRTYLLEVSLEGESSALNFAIHLADI